jgi:geranylgeranyl diphosphate synthase type II
MEPPLSATEVSKLVAEEIQKLHLPQKPEKLYDPIQYILSLGGKRIRPLLALMSYNLFSDVFSPVMQPAMSVEIFHNFSLVHDDIMDKALMRRGQETVHIKWDENVAILSGDAMLVKAYENFEEVHEAYLPKLLKSFNKTAREVCEGQQLDMDFEERSLVDNPVSEIEYLNMIRLKTAVLFGFSLELGGIISDVGEAESNQLYEAGVHLGLAFQLQDDLLDLYGDEKFGKQIGGDILNAKKTYMLVKALALASKVDSEMIIDKINDLNIDEDKKISIVKGLYDKYQIPDLVQNQIEINLENFRKSILKINSSRSEHLLQFVSSITHRTI